MARYEFIREIFNNCSGNQMRDVDIEEIETDDIDSVAQVYIDDAKSKVEVLDNGKGTVIYDISNAGLQERLSFTILSE